jgi:hypothetical protein
MTKKKEPSAPSVPVAFTNRFREDGDLRRATYTASATIISLAPKERFITHAPRLSVHWTATDPDGSPYRTSNFGARTYLAIEVPQSFATLSRTEAAALAAAIQEALKQPL